MYSCLHAISEEESFKLLVFIVIHVFVFDELWVWMTSQIEPQKTPQTCFTRGSTDWRVSGRFACTFWQFLWIYNQIWKTAIKDLCICEQITRVKPAENMLSDAVTLKMILSVGHGNFCFYITLTHQNKFNNYFFLIWISTCLSISSNLSWNDLYNQADYTLKKMLVLFSLPKCWVVFLFT